VIVGTRETTPLDAANCSARNAPKAAGFRDMTISVWRAFNLLPYRAETFQPSPDPLSVPKARDIVELHLNPPDRAIVPCVDEKSQIQARRCR